MPKLPPSRQLKFLSGGTAEVAPIPDGTTFSKQNTAQAIALLQQRLDAGFPCPTGCGPTPPLAVIATGGTGRGELCPQSDLDLLFVLPDAPPRQLETLPELLAQLWDEGFRVSAVTRTLKECDAALREDHTFVTALLDARPVWGAPQLTHALLRQRDRFLSSPHRRKAFIQDKIRERDARHARMGASRYQVEPHLKDSPGALRDLQALAWVVQAHTGTAIPAETILRSHGILRAEEIRRLQRARRFLLTLRCNLHLLAGKPEERLTQPRQEELARHLGYAVRRGRPASERLMRHYYLTVRDVGLLWRHVMAALKPKNAPWLRPDGFLLQSGSLLLQGDAHLQARPQDIFRLFEASMLERRPIHPRALAQITRYLRRPPAGWRQDAENNQRFCAILCHPRGASGTLRLMNECGVLGAFMPDFARIIGLRQPDGYHLYTVDEHTLQTLHVLHSILSGKRAEEFPIASHIAPKLDTTDTRILCVALLLHDIAKGRGGDHAILGAECARQLGPRLGMSEDETAEIAWLVRWHLLLSDTAFRRDLDDPQIIGDVADIIGTPIRLERLLILTIADINGVGEGRWTEWKAMLLRKLFRQVQHRLGNARAEDFRQYEASAPDVSAQLQQQWQSRGAAGAAPLALHWQSDPRAQITHLHLLTTDQPGQFAEMTAHLAAHGANILAARGRHVTPAHIATHFVLQYYAGGGALPEEKMRDIAAAITSSLTHGAPPPVPSAPPRWQQRPPAAGIPRRVVIHQDSAHGPLLIEVTGPDSPGALARLAAVLRDFGLDIESAAIATYGERVVDSFTLLPGARTHPPDAAWENQLRTALLSALD